MAVAIQTLPAGSQTTITLKSSAIDHTPYLGGPVQRVARLGDRWTYAVDLRAMHSVQSRPLITALLLGLTEKILCPIVIEGISLAGQTNVTVVSGAGRSLTFAGNADGKSSGQFFNVIKNGVRYLHMVVAIVDKTITFTPALKVTLTGGETLNFTAPCIEGFLDGNEQAWTVGLASNVGLSFKINESQ